MVETITPDNTQVAQPEAIGTIPAQGVATAFPQADDQPRAPKTHISDAIKRLFKGLPLLAKLKKNKQIETENQQRIEKSVNHVLNPAEYPDDGSDAASYLTIDSSEMNTLSGSNFSEILRKEAPFYILEKLSDLKATDTDSKRKRDPDALDLTDPDKARDLKRRVMSGASLVSRNGDQPLETNFPDIMFTTEDKVALPLSFFTHYSLQHILDFTALLPTRKIHTGDAKSCTIIDVDKLSHTLGGELSLNYGQFMEAAFQMLRFQSFRDKDRGDLTGSKLSWTDTWRKHFAFFENQPDAERYYEDWKHMEFELRQERRRHNFAYDPEHYKLKYAMAKNNAMQREDFAKRESKILSQLESKFRSFSNTSYANQNSFPPRANTSRPFQSAGTGQSSAAGFCIICADKDHLLPNHPKDRSKFKDGKPLWSKLDSEGKIRSSDGQEICIRYNISGRSACTGIRKHPMQNRAHVCSFCGERSHHALSWTCRSQY